MISRLTRLSREPAHALDLHLPAVFLGHLKTLPTAQMDLNLFASELGMGICMPPNLLVIRLVFRRTSARHEGRPGRHQRGRSRANRLSHRSLRG